MVRRYSYYTNDKDDIDMKDFEERIDEAMARIDRDLERMTSSADRMFKRADKNFSTTMKSAEESLRRAKERVQGATTRAKNKSRIVINGREINIDGDEFTIDPGLRRLKAIRNLMFMAVLIGVFIFGFVLMSTLLNSQKYKQKPLDPKPAKQIEQPLTPEPSGNKKL